MTQKANKMAQGDVRSSAERLPAALRASAVGPASDAARESRPSGLTGQLLQESQRVADEVRKVNVDMPVWMIAALDEEANRLSVPRQAVIKMLIDEGLDRRKAERLRRLSLAAEIDRAL